MGCMCYFSYRIYDYLIEEKKNKELNKNLINEVVTVEIESNNEASSNNENEEKEIKAPLEVDFEALKQKNKDIIGWIYLENTPITFPVVQSNNNDYYLRRLLDGTYNTAGTIFMDYRNDSKMGDWNTIIYGHNMKNGTMFATLKNFKEQSYYDEHKTMYYLTESKNYKVELVAGYTESDDAIIYNIPANTNNKNKILENAKNKSTFKSNVEFENEDKILTLSTCSYEYEGARYVLIGVLKEI